MLMIFALISSSTSATLQVSPVTLMLKGNKQSENLWLNNDGDRIISAQVRVFNWTQSDFTDKYESTRNIVVSPPIVTIMPGQRQLVRIINISSPYDRAEHAYRLSVNELPAPFQKMNQLQFLLHYSIPVFHIPESDTLPTVELKWNIYQHNESVYLDVTNQGTGHAQLSEATWVNHSGERREISKGLMGYVLSGSTMRWVIPGQSGVNFQGGKLEVTVNGQKTVQPL